MLSNRSIRQVVVMTPLNRLARLCWAGAYFISFRFTPVPLHGLRRLVLPGFGAKVSKDARIYPSCRIWAPWNLRLGPGAGIGPHVICYNVQTIELMERSIVSQYSFLCTASHEYETGRFETIASPITIGPNAW